MAPLSRLYAFLERVGWVVHVVVLKLVLMVIVLRIDHIDDWVKQASIPHTGILSVRFKTGKSGF